MIFDNAQKSWEAGDKFRVCSASILLAGKWAGRPLSLPWACRRDSRRDAGATLDAPVKILLETGHLNIEAEYFRGILMFAGKMFGPPDALLPGCLGH